MTLQLKVSPPYDFNQSVRDYGWVALAPFHWQEDQHALRRIERLADGRVVLLLISAQNVGDHVHIHIDVETEAVLSAADEQEILDRVHWMLKLNEDFTEFYALAADHPPLADKVASGRGRLLRSSSLFEDVVKTICTTNTTWSQTKQMVARLVKHLGDPYPLQPELHAFPTPAQVAEADEGLFESEIKLGYRNAFVLRLAREIAEGQRDLEALRASDLPAKDLKRELKKIMGVGDYAAHTLLMILGCYEEVAIDSEFRSHVTRAYFDGKAVTEREMAAIYDRWGRWKYLAYWFDNY